MKLIWINRRPILVRVYHVLFNSINVWDVQRLHWFKWKRMYTESTEEKAKEYVAELVSFKHSHDFQLVNSESFKKAGRYQWVFIQVSHHQCACGKKMKIVNKHSCQDKELGQAPEWVKKIIKEKNRIDGSGIKSWWD